jgi:drug/metabolite transporter (DMT)-like permease
MPTEPTNRRMGRAEWLLLILLSVLWGGSFFFNQIAVAALPPLTVVAARVALAAAILWAVLRARGQSMGFAPPVWAAFLGMGILNNAIPFTLIVWGQSVIASGVAAILNAATPLFTVVLAHVLTADERMTPARLAGVLIGLAGVAAMMGGAALRGLGGDIAAQAACLAGAASYALAGIYGQRFRRLGVPPMATAAGQVTASSLILVPLALAVDRPWTLAIPGWEVIAALAGVASLSTALAYVVYFRLLARAGATNLLLVTFLIPVTAILLGVAVLGEVLLPRHLAGMALIAAGLVAIDGRPVAALRRRPVRARYQ